MSGDSCRGLAVHFTRSLDLQLATHPFSPEPVLPTKHTVPGQTRVSQQSESASTRSSVDLTEAQERGLELSQRVSPTAGQETKNLLPASTRSSVDLTEAQERGLELSQRVSPTAGQETKNLLPASTRSSVDLTEAQERGLELSQRVSPTAGQEETKNLLPASTRSSVDLTEAQERGLERSQRVSPTAGEETKNLLPASTRSSVDLTGTGTRTGAIPESVPYSWRRDKKPAASIHTFLCRSDRHRNEDRSYPRECPLQLEKRQKTCCQRPHVPL